MQFQEYAFSLLNDELLGERVKKAYSTLSKKYNNIVPLISPMSQFLFKQFYYSLMIDDKSNIEIGYHGTSKLVVDSICTFGMLDPTSEKYKVRNANLYGRGVYVSPNINFASSYGSGPDRCILAVLFIRGLVKDITASNKDINGDYCNPINDIVVLRSTTQVLPLFAAFNDGKTNESKSIEDLYANISYDKELLDIAIEINELDTNVNLLVIYNLLIREIANGLEKEQAKIIIAGKITDFDYSGY